MRQQPQAPPSSRQISRSLVQWYRKAARELPWRRTQVPYAIWISEIMCQQTQVRTVIPYWERWMTLFPNVQALADAPEESILKAWEGLGYYTRARNLQKAARIILAEHGGAFPSTFEEVLALPGIGRYTAGAICSICYGLPTPILDGNVARVLSRLLGITGDIKSLSTRDRLWEASESMVRAAQKEPATLNQALMELGALICIPREPLCQSCPVRPNCFAFKHGETSRLPHSAPRRKPTQRLFLAFILMHEGKVLVRRREPGQINSGLWEFPNFEPTDKRRYRAEIPGYLGCTPKPLRPWLVFKHSITTSRITLRAFRAELNGESREAAEKLGGLWKSQEQLQALPFTAAHSRIRATIGIDAA